MGEVCKRSNGAELVDWYPDGYLKKAQGAKVDDAMRLKYASENRAYARHGSAWNILTNRKFFGRGKARKVSWPRNIKARGPACTVDL